MFTHAVEPKLGIQSEIAIRGVDGDVLQQLIEYCYSGEITIDARNVREMTRAAMMLQFTDVQEHCAAFYSTILNASNCLSIREVADLYNISGLKGEAHYIVVKHFMEVFKGEEFVQLSVDDLAALLGDDEINVTKEEDVFEALMRWVQHDVERRKPSLGFLLDVVRFQHIGESVSD